MHKTVLISQPQLDYGFPYLPIMWGILKTYWEKHGGDTDRVRWLPPVQQMTEIDRILEGGTPIDVLGMSCYNWSWKAQCRIAKTVKARYPDCLVIAGGPEPDYKDREFFKKHPYIDLVAVKDGEITFTSVLNKVLSCDRVSDVPSLFGSVPGLYLASPESGMPHCTGAAEVPKTFEYSPYVEQADYYESFRRTLGHMVVAVFETNRGCPYRCSFCDWGSNTMSKLRQFPIERVQAEIDWFGRNRVGFLYSADANFGILPRDIDIADMVTACRDSFGYPKFFSYNTAKNNPGRTVTIAKKFAAVGLLPAHHVSIQHTSDEVLAATARENISLDKQYAAVRSLMLDDGVAIYVQLILGIPGDNLSLWKKCFPDLMERGIHSYYWVTNYNLLPNAPAAEPEYKEKWQIQTEERYILLNHGIRKRGPIDPDDANRTPLIVQTRTFSRSDWVEMNAYGVYVRAMHNCSVTQMIAIYMRLTHNVSYHDFYQDLFDNFFVANRLTLDWYDDVRACYRDYLEDTSCVAFMRVPQLPDYENDVEPSRWLYTQLCFQVDAFFDLLKPHLLRRYPSVVNLESVIDYSRHMMVLPDYDSKAGKSFPTDFDWGAYFERAWQLANEAMPEPRPVPGGEVRVTDTAWFDEGGSVALEWGEGDERARWRKWIEVMVLGRNSSKKNNFQQVQTLQPQLIG